ncbi:hypothetical protein MPTK2_3g16600 [Marchantia polymorpha subsp. ruderalis]
MLLPPLCHQSGISMEKNEMFVPLDASGLLYEQLFEKENDSLFGLTDFNTTFDAAESVPSYTVFHDPDVELQLDPLLSCQYYDEASYDAFGQDLQLDSNLAASHLTPFLPQQMQLKDRLDSHQSCDILSRDSVIFDHDIAKLPSLPLLASTLHPPSRDLMMDTSPYYQSLELESPVDSGSINSSFSELQYDSRSFVEPLQMRAPLVGYPNVQILSAAHTTGDMEYTYDPRVYNVWGSTDPRIYIEYSDMCERGLVMPTSMNCNYKEVPATTAFNIHAAFAPSTCSNRELCPIPMYSVMQSAPLQVSSIRTHGHVQGENGKMIAEIPLSDPVRSSVEYKQSLRGYSNVTHTETWKDEECVPPYLIRGSTLMDRCGKQSKFGKRGRLLARKDETLSMSSKKEESMTDVPKTENGNLKTLSGARKKRARKTVEKKLNEAIMIFNNMDPQANAEGTPTGSEREDIAWEQSSADVRRDFTASDLHPPKGHMVGDNAVEKLEDGVVCADDDCPKESPAGHVKDEKPAFLHERTLMQNSPVDKYSIPNSHNALRVADSIEGSRYTCTEVDVLGSGGSSTIYTGSQVHSRLTEMGKAERPRENTPTSRQTPVTVTDAERCNTDSPEESINADSHEIAKVVIGAGDRKEENHGILPPEVHTCTEADSSGQFPSLGPGEIEDGLCATTSGEANAEVLNDREKSISHAAVSVDSASNKIVGIDENLCDMSLSSHAVKQVEFHNSSLDSHLTSLDDVKLSFSGSGSGITINSSRYSNDKKYLPAGKDSKSSDDDCKAEGEASYSRHVELLATDHISSSHAAAAGSFEIEGKEKETCEEDPSIGEPTPKSTHVPAFTSSFFTPMNRSSVSDCHAEADYEKYKTDLTSCHGNIKSIDESIGRDFDISRRSIFTVLSGCNSDLAIKVKVDNDPKLELQVEYSEAPTLSSISDAKMDSEVSASKEETDIASELNGLPETASSHGDLYGTTIICPDNRAAEKRKAENDVDTSKIADIRRKGKAHAQRLYSTSGQEEASKPEILNPYQQKIMDLLTDFIESGYGAGVKIDETLNERYDESDVYAELKAGTVIVPNMMPSCETGKGQKRRWKSHARQGRVRSMIEAGCSNASTSSQPLSKVCNTDVLRDQKSLYRTTPEKVHRTRSRSRSGWGGLRKF